MERAQRELQADYEVRREKIFPLRLSLGMVVHESLIEAGHTTWKRMPFLLGATAAVAIVGAVILVL